MSTSKSRNSVLQNAKTLTPSRIALNPLITSTLLWLLTTTSRNPAQWRASLQQHIPALRNPAVVKRIARILKTLIAIGVLRAVNGRLNRRALNPGRSAQVESKKWNMKEEIAVVTGGCGGIGEEIVKGLVEEGVTVAVLDVVEVLPESLRGNPQIHHHTCDITSASSIETTATKIRNTLGAPTILINNAGILTPHTILNTTPAQLQTLFSVNLFSNYALVQTFLPAMLANNKGHIVTVASIASYFTVAGMVDYCASKAAVLAFHEGLAQELRVVHKKDGVLLTSVHPSWARTPMIRDWEAGLAKVGQGLVEPRDVARRVVSAVAEGVGQQILVPDSWSAKVVCGLRAAPNWVQEAVRKGPSRVVAGFVKEV